MPSRRRPITLLGGAMFALSLAAVAAWAFDAPFSSAPASVVAQPASDAADPGDAAPESKPAIDPENDPAEASDPAVPDVSVTLHDGRRFSGQIIERNARELVLDADGAVLRFQTRDVDRVETLEPVSVIYARMRASIDDFDSEQLLLLAEWLMDKRRYRSALREVEGVLRRDPENQSAETLARMLRAQIRLLEEPGAPARPNASRRQERREFPTLTPEQVNLINVYELDLRRSGRVDVPRAAIDRLLKDYEKHELIPATREGREALYRKPATELVDLIFRVQARDLYPQVRVLDHPPSMRAFREDVHRDWFFRGCASNKCHGGEEAGRLWLATDAPNTDTTIYTNFLILERFRLPDGTPLINYDTPAESPLLQFALPPDASKRPHPPIPEGDRSQPWRGVLKGLDDERYEKTLAWIRSMYRPRHEYPIDYTPPVPGEDPRGNP